MNKITGPILIALLTLGLGCAKPGKGGDVAIVDLDKIATDLEWHKQIGTALESAEQEVRTQLQTVAQSAAASIDTAKNEVIADANLNAQQIKLLNTIQDMRDLEKLPLTEAQRTKLIQTVNQANVTLQTAQARSQQVMQEQRAALVTRYRDLVRPIAQQIATEAGFQVIFTADQTVLYHVAAVDITDRVIEKLKASAPAAAPFVAPTK